MNNKELLQDKTIEALLGTLEEDKGLNKGEIKLFLSSPLWGTVSTDEDMEIDFGGELLENIIDFYDLDPEEIAEQVRCNENLAEYINEEDLKKEVRDIKLFMDPNMCKLIAQVTCNKIVLENDELMKKLEDYLLGQYSDGWGEGFEQNSILDFDTVTDVPVYDDDGFEDGTEQVSTKGHLYVSAWSSYGDVVFEQEDVIENA